MESLSNQTSPHRVLYLDDNVETCTLVKLNLERMGIIVDVFYTPDDVNASDLSSYSLIITDYRLAGSRNGLEVIRDFREKGLIGDCILVTGFGDENVLTEALRTGVIDFVSKNHIFFENLVHVVSRSLELRSKEEEILAQKLRAEAFFMLGEILESAQIDHWIFHELDKSENRFPIQFFKKLGVDVSDFQTFWKRLSLKQRFNILRRLTVARKARSNFEALISFDHEPSTLWFRIRGAFDSKTPGRTYGIVLDETNSVLNEKKLSEILYQKEEIAERLQLSMLETHHRVKNSFQMMRSLLNMQLRGKENLDRDAVNNISNHLYGLSTIHDLLTSRATHNNPLEEINLEELLSQLISNLPLNSSDRASIDCDEVRVNPRIASTFAVVVNELLMNAIKYGSGEISICCRALGNKSCKVTISNETQKSVTNDYFQKSKSGAGISLIKFLSKADLKQEAKWNVDGSKVSTELVFPIV